MITPRTTRLIRVNDLHAFREAVLALAFDGAPGEARSRLVVVPSHAAAAFLTAAAERGALGDSGALLHPEFITSAEVAARFGTRVDASLSPSSPERREILMGVACREAVKEGDPPPFELRPGLIAQVLSFYDTLTDNRRDIATFERLALGRLEPGAEYDRGAERLVRQTTFLVAAFKAFERLSAERGVVDSRRFRTTALLESAARPWKHVVVTVADKSRDRHGLCDADWDLLTRVPGLERIDLVVTDRSLAGPWHERVHQLLPGISEVRWQSARLRPTLRVPSAHTARSDERHGARVLPFAWKARDREDEVADFARWTRQLRRDDTEIELERVALVIRQPLPYVYLAREVLRSANIECQTFDTLPLAAEPYAAAVDLVFSAIRTNVSRSAGIALLRCPQLRWMVDEHVVSLYAIAAADAWLSECGYLGGREALRAIVSNPPQRPSATRVAAEPALRALLDIADELAPLTADAPAADHLGRLSAFLRIHDGDVPEDAAIRGRLRRARVAVLGIVTTLEDEYRTLDQEPVPWERVAAHVRRWIDAHTFAPRAGDRGVHVVDVESARFGEFDYVQLAGVVDGEWPERRARNIFYGASLLADLGWSSESDLADHARDAFVDLLDLPLRELTVSTFDLEEDAQVAPSSFLDEIEPARLAIRTEEPSNLRVLEVELLGLEPVASSSLGDVIRGEVERRLARPSVADARFHGATRGHVVQAYSMSSLERYQDCPFVYFSADVLRLSETPEDEPFLSPRARGRFIHEAFQRFFEAWDAEGPRAITVDGLAEARELFIRIADPLLAGLNESDAALERARLFGSAIATGIVDVVLGLEASSPDTVTGRLVESSLRGVFSLGLGSHVGIPIRGIADRIDLLDGRRLRVVDYKSGYAPMITRALQVPIYALCAQEQLTLRDGVPWRIDSAAYIAFSGRRALVPVIESGEDPEPTLASARARMLELVDGVSAGMFPPRPHDITRCRSCAFASVCRKDYVNG